MNNIKKILSTLLAALMMFAAFATVLGMNITVSAENSTTTEETTDNENEPEDRSIDILKVVYKTPEDKLKDMRLRIENDNYQLYVRAAYGEIPHRNDGHVVLHRLAPAAVVAGIPDPERQPVREKNDAAQYHPQTSAILSSVA